MSLDDLATDGQSQAGTANVAVSQALDAEELVEDAAQRLARNADAGVADTHLDGVFRGARCDVDRSTAGRVLASVRKEIREHLLDAVGLGQSHG